MDDLLVPPAAPRRATPGTGFGTERAERGHPLAARAAGGRGSRRRHREPAGGDVLSIAGTVDAMLGRNGEHDCEPDPARTIALRGTFDLREVVPDDD
jgi:hypothetical protein